MAVTARQLIARWTAGENGFEVGKKIEYEVVESVTDKNQRFQSITFYKPYVKNTGEIGKAFGFDVDRGIPELIERINHFLMTYTQRKGQYVFQPFGQQMQQPMGYQPVAPAPYGGPPPQMMPHQVPPAQQQPMGYQPVAPNGYNPSPQAQQQWGNGPTQPAQPAQVPMPQGGYVPNR